jgi:putative transposase
MDFFTVPTFTFGILHCFFVIAHDRRKILHCKVTRNPQALWVGQQLREAWAYTEPHRFLLSTATQSLEPIVVSAVKNIRSQPTRTAFRSPWQNAVAERWEGSCRRDLLDHVIILNEQHLKRLLSLYLAYRGPDSSGTREGHASRAAYSSPLWGRKQGSIPGETRRPAPSVCGSSVDSKLFF